MAHDRISKAWRKYLKSRRRAERLLRRRQDKNLTTAPERIGYVTHHGGHSDLAVIDPAAVVTAQLWDIQVTRQIPLYVELPAMLYARIIAYCRAVDYEVSGLGSCAYDATTGRVLVTGLAPLPVQVGNAGHTELNQDDLARIMVKRIRSGNRAPLNFWWHSHVNMGTFWSGTDEATSKQYGDGKQIFLSIVAVQNGNMRAKVHTQVETWHSYADQVPIHVRQTAPGMAPDIDALVPGARKEIAAKVKHTLEPVITYGNGYRYTPDDDWRWLPAYYRDHRQPHTREPWITHAKGTPPGAVSAPAPDAGPISRQPIGTPIYDREGNIIGEETRQPVAPYVDGEAWWQRPGACD